MSLPDDIRPLIEQLSDLAEVSEVQTMLFARVVALAQHANGAENDQLLDAKEAAQMLGLSESYLYHARKLPYAITIGKRRLFSRKGIQRYIARQQGKA